MTAVLYGTQWSGPITYSFADSFADFGVGYSHTVGGFQQVSATQMNAIQSILEGTTVSGTPLFTFGSFEQVANLDISLAANPAGASDLTIGQTNLSMDPIFRPRASQIFPNSTSVHQAATSGSAMITRNTVRPRSEPTPGPRTSTNSAMPSASATAMMKAPPYRAWFRHSSRPRCDGILCHDLSKLYR